MSKKSIQVVLLLTAVACTGWSHSRVPHTNRTDLGASFVPIPKVAKAASFGFDALLADYHWLQAVQVAGGKEIIDAETADHLAKLIDVVTTLNPHVGHPYRFAAVWLTHDEAQVREGNRLLRRAIEYHPDDWRNYFYLGFNHFFFLGEFEEAANALEVAMDLPGAPAYLPRLVARLKSETRDIEVAEVFLRELLRTSPDEDAKTKIRIALDEIEIEHKARLLDRAREAFKSLVGRDIRDVAELVREPHRMLERLPNPEPDALPTSLSRGSVWRIDPGSNRIVSSYLRGRYEVHYTEMDRQRLEEWGVERADSAAAMEEDQGDG